MKLSLSSLHRKVLLVLLLALVVFVFAVITVSSVSDDRSRSEEKEQRNSDFDLDLVVLSYYSGQDASNEDEEPLLVQSIAQSQDDSGDTESIKVITVGKDAHLWTDYHEDELEETRGWMFRFRLIVQVLKDEYEKRKGEDFIAVLADALDVFVPASVNSNTMELVKNRFLADFAAHEYSIVFSTQVYCCNPWNLRDVARESWDAFYEKRGAIDTIYKHLNAGLFMGYASAILEMADEMNAFEMSFRRPEYFDDRIGDVTMSSIQVDDDEWQLAVWYLHEHTTRASNKQPRAIMDVQHKIFTTTGTFRASHRGDGFLLFSQNDFKSMFGPFPTNNDDDGVYNSNRFLQHITQCPYEYDNEKKQFKNTITQSNPLLFHFAGNDWLCACQIFEQEDYRDIHSKFERYCRDEYPYWRPRINKAVEMVSIAQNPDRQLFLTRDNYEWLKLLQFAPTAAPSSTDEPIPSPVASPVAAPTLPNGPIAPPVSTPIAPPITQPISPPQAPPPITPPVSPPIAPPIAPPVSEPDVPQPAPTPVSPPVTPPVAVPSLAPTRNDQAGQTPSSQPAFTEAPVILIVPPGQPPILAPTIAPVIPPTTEQPPIIPKSPVAPMAPTSVEPPANVPTTTDSGGKGTSSKSSKSSKTRGSSKASKGKGGSSSKGSRVKKQKIGSKSMKLNS